MTALIAEVVAQRLVLCWSDALDFECIEKGPMDRHPWVLEVRRLAICRVAYHHTVRRRAVELAAKPFGLRTHDALHLALAERARAALVTVDRRFLRRCRTLQTLISVEVLDPVEAAARMIP